eukprot:scaffold170451_cov33-Attheya_sp.AAC.2
MKGWRGGTWLVLEGKGYEGADLLAIGYCKERAGHTEPGEPYEACWTPDKHANTHSCKIAHPTFSWVSWKAALFFKGASNQLTESASGYLTR